MRVLSSLSLSLHAAGYLTMRYCSSLFFGISPTLVSVSQRASWRQTRTIWNRHPTVAVWTGHSAKKPTIFFSGFLIKIYFSFLEYNYTIITNKQSHLKTRPMFLWRCVGTFSRNGTVPLLYKLRHSSRHISRALAFVRRRLSVNCNSCVYTQEDVLRRPLR